MEDGAATPGKKTIHTLHNLHNLPFWVTVFSE